MNGYVSGEKIMDALDLLDGDLAEEVAKLREKKKRRPVLWRYGALAACFALVLLVAVKLAPLLGLNAEEDLAGDGFAPENAPESAPEFSLDGTVGGNGNTGNDEGTGEPGKSEGIAGPSDELPAFLLRVEGWANDLLLCTVVDNDGFAQFPEGSTVFLLFDKWEGKAVTETAFASGSLWSIMFDGYQGELLFAVDGYEVEE